jgi:DNA-binding NtrC family response regulator
MPKLKTAIISTLIVDHEEFGNTHLQSIFNENDLHLDIHSPHCDFLNVIEKKKYDCVMINSDLMNNLTMEFIDKVKGNYPSIIVIILLKNPSYEKIFNFVRAGVDDFIMKPFTWEDVERTLTFYYY